MNITRYIKKQIEADLKEKMVFLGGPRQVGKTTLAREFIKKPEQYYSWDILEQRELIKKHQFDLNLKLIVFDEIHKYTRWRMLVKGIYDQYLNKLAVLVTGSARLDHFRRGGDSLVGRYHYLRLHPLSLAEVDNKFQRKTTELLLKHSGFPEPFFKKSDTFYRRWKRERLSRVVYQDLRDLDTVKDLSKIELLVDALPARVGSVLSIKSLQEDLDVSPNTVSRWIEVLESIYYCYRILPYGYPKLRAVKKSNKLYLWDWAEVESPGARFENMVASQLLKYCHYREDSEGYRMEIRFIRDVDLREIDFVVLQDNRPLFAVECKTGDRDISPHFKYFSERTPIPVFYQVHLGQKKYSYQNFHLLPFEDFCKILNMP